jgi:protocatechuate 3,4-dioxygenase beta subunit
MRSRLTVVLIVLAALGTLAAAYAPLREAFFPPSTSDDDDAWLDEEGAGGAGGAGGDVGVDAGGAGLRLLQADRKRGDPAAEEARLAALAQAQAAADAQARAALAVGWAGALVDASGRPVAGARLVLSNGEGTHTLTTREDGTFDASVTPGRYDLLVTAAGRGSLYVQDYLVDGVARLDLALQLAPVLTLRFQLQREGRGVDGAVAVLALTRARWLGKEAAVGNVTDADGRATFGDLVAGTYELRVQVPEGAELVQTFELKQDVEVVAQVPAAAELSGTVTDGATTSPVGGALVRVVTAVKGGPSFVTSIQTQADGTFHAYVPKGQASEVSVTATGFAPWPPQREAGAALGRLKGLASGTAPVVFPVTLRLGGAVSGQVVQQQTKLPLAGVSLRFAENRGASAYATTDAEGRYALAHLNPGRYQVTVESPGWFPERPLELRLPGRQSEPMAFDIELIGAGTLSGTVVMPEGAPIKGARVWLTGGGQLVRSARGAGRPLETFTGASGRWELHDVPPHLSVVVRAQLGSLEATPIGVHMKQPPAAPLRLVLAGTVNLQGRVVDQGDGSPVANARVRIVPKGPPWGREGRALTTDTEGAFRTETLIAGDYELTPLHSHYLVGTPRLVTLSADDAEERVELALDPGLVLGGLLTDERGRPLVGTVAADGTPDGQTSPLRRSQATGPDGRFRLTGFPPGTYRVRASAKGYKNQSLEGLRGGESRLRFSLIAVAPPQGS